MSTIYNHILMGSVDKNGKVNIMYPTTSSEDVIIDSINNSIPYNVSNLQQLTDKFGPLAFSDNGDVIYYEFEKDSSSSVPSNYNYSEIDDEKTTEYSTYSSKKINQLLSENKNTALEEYQLFLLQYKRDLINEIINELNNR